MMIVYQLEDGLGRGWEDVGGGKMFVKKNLKLFFVL